MCSEGRPVVVAALSGRALAAAACRAGERVIVLDRFCDEDTRRLAVRCSPVTADAHGGLARRPLLATMRALRGKVQGLVYGAGLERDPGLLADVALLIPILGNPSEVVRAVKDPFRFAALLARLGIPHPPVCGDAPANTGWLRKAIGGAGGAHIAWAGDGAAASGSYAQQAVTGRAVSAAFVADGRHAKVIAFTEQWASPAPGAPFRYGGCAGPVRLVPGPASGGLAARIAEACDAIAGAASLVGLNSLDLLVDGRTFHVLEVNPRPGASLDVLDGLDRTSLWQLHREAIGGRLPRRSLGIRKVRAARVVYAPRRLVVPHGFAWPAWSADRGPAGTVVRRGEPTCTVFARAESAAAACARVEGRAARLLARLAAAQPAAPRLGERHAEHVVLA